MTYIQAALTVLAYADRPLTIGEMTAVALAHKLVRPRGKTPDRTMASVLYRRMAADPDAPVISRGGRFWLRGRAVPADESAYLTQRARRTHSSARHQRGAAHSTAVHRSMVLPPPPIRLPDEALTAAGNTEQPDAHFAPTRRERAIERAAERGARLLNRLDARRASAVDWDVAHTDTRLVAPLLSHLGYRRDRDVTRSAHAGRGVRGYLLAAGDAPTISLVIWRLSHPLDDDNAWHALGLARDANAPYTAITNGRELRLYSAALAEAHDDMATALVLTLDLTDASAIDEARDRQATALWLLSRPVVASGALDAYTLNQSVGAVLLGALDAPDSPLAQALIAEVRTQIGLFVPADVVLRHARLALRGRRGRDGEPHPEDTATVAAVHGPRLELPLPVIARSA